MVNVLRFAVLFTILSTPAWAGTYYVAPGGLDSWPGTELQPWATIQHAADTLVPGDTVNVKAGTYNERVAPLNSGEAGNLITYAAYPGDIVTIDGQGITVPEYSGLFDLSGKSYINVTGFHVINSNEAGILGDNSTYLTIADNYTYNTGTSGISVWGCNHITIEGNEVERACTGLYQECISVSGTDVFEVVDNYVHDVGNGDKEGLCIKDGSANGTVHGNIVHDTLLGIYVDAEFNHTHDVQVYNNITHDNTHDGIALATEQGALLEGISVFNNISYNNGWNGLDITACCVSTHPMSNISVVNNTFYSNGFGALDWGQGIYVENWDITGLHMVNNICSQNNSFQIAVDPYPLPDGFVVDYNLVDGLPETLYGAHDATGDPRFLDAAAADFHLQTDSPARNAGTGTGAPADDFDGNIRPQESYWDIGAYEFSIAGPDFAVTCNPGSLAIVQGTAETTVCTVYSFNGFDSPVDLTCSGQPAGTTCAFTPSQVTPPADGSITCSLQISVDAGAATGTFPFQVVGTGGATRSFGFTLTVRPPCLFCDEFDDGVTDWSYPKGNWWEDSGYLNGQASRKAIALATTLFPGCDVCSVEARLQTAGGYSNKVWLLGWYVDKSNYVELMMKQEVGKWLLKQHVDKAVVRKAKAITSIDPNVIYEAKISFDGFEFQVSVDGTTLITMPKYPGTYPNGSVGLQVKATTGTFDNIDVQAP